MFKAEEIGRSQFFLKLILYMEKLEEFSFIEFFLLFEKLALRIGAHDEKIKTRKFVAEFAENIVHLVLLFRKWEIPETEEKDIQFYITEVALLYPFSYQDSDALKELKETCQILRKFSRSITKEDVLLSQLTQQGFISIRESLYHVIVDQTVKDMVVQKKKDDSIKVIESLIIQKSIVSPFEFRSETAKNRLWSILQAYHSPSDLPNSSVDLVTKSKEHLPIRINLYRKAKEKSIPTSSYGGSNRNENEQRKRRKKVNKSEGEESEGEESMEEQILETMQPGTKSKEECRIAIAQNTRSQSIIHSEEPASFHAQVFTSTTQSSNVTATPEMIETYEDALHPAVKCKLSDGKEKETKQEGIEENIEFNSPKEAITWLVNKMSIYKDISVEEILDGIQDLLLGNESEFFDKF